MSVLELLSEASVTASLEVVDWPSDWRAVIALGEAGVARAETPEDTGSEGLDGTGG